MQRHCYILASVLLLVTACCFQANGFAQALKPIDNNIPAIEPMQKPQVMMSGSMGASIPPNNGNTVIAGGTVAETQNANPYAPYFGQVMKEVRRHWYSVKAGWAPLVPITQPLKIGLAFKVRRDGMITDIRVRTSSDNINFDLVAVQSLKDTSVPPIPVAISEDTIDCYYTVHYDPTNSRGH